MSDSPPKMNLVEGVASTFHLERPSAGSSMEMSCERNAGEGTEEKESRAPKLFAFLRKVASHTSLHSPLRASSFPWFMIKEANVF